ncbi:MAG: LPXTG cell wall anchor domain-containing protein [Eubacteriaceae bacterium]|nr:LPXTG cell wall anchor domain-containing protein [Eubacteriaceae bacterium]
MKKKIIVFLISLLMMLVLFPISTLAEDVNSDGYNDNDFNKIQMFLNQPSAISGKTNGDCINPASYNAADPTTWLGVTWSSDTEKRVTAINWMDIGLAGNMDISNLTSLTNLQCYYNEISSINLSGDTALNVIDVCNNNLSSLSIPSNPQYLCCGYNNITSLNLSGKNNLTYLYCTDNQLTSLNISGCSSLYQLYCDYNKLSGTLDVSELNGLYYLFCNDNSLSSLVLSDDNWYSYLYTQNNKIKSITTSMFASGQIFTASGNGYINLNMDISDYEIYLLGDSYSNSLFYNWTAGDNEISDSPIHYLNPQQPATFSLTANFKPGLTASPSDGVIYEGGRITISPLFEGGTWKYDDKYLSGNFSNAENPEFKGLKSGKTTVEYTSPDYDYEEAPYSEGEGDRISANSAGSNSWAAHQNLPDIKSYNQHQKDTVAIQQEETEGPDLTTEMEITIKDTLLPQTGQNFIPAIMLGSIGLITASAILLIKRKNKKA